MAYNFTRNYYNPALYFNQIATYGYPNLGQNFFNSITGNGLTLYTSNAVYEYYGSNPSLNRWSWFSANNTLLPLVFGVNHGYIPGGLYYN